MREAVANTGPGPANYDLPTTVGYNKHDFTRLRNPAYSMRQRTGIGGKYVGPGPKYDLGANTRFGNSKAAAYTMRPKLNQLASFKGPGPGTYSPETCPPMKTPRPPAYTLGARTNRKHLNESPGPNAYDLPQCLGPKIPDKWAAPAATLTGRNKGLSNKGSPGPAAYDAPTLNKYKPKLPQYSIAGRHGGGGSKNQTPGPAAYDSNYRKKNEPKFSFGQKHTECKTPCITAADNTPTPKHVRCDAPPPQVAPYC